MITAYRLVKARYAAGTFSGEGAWLHGGRWSSPGAAVAYCSSTLALATLEVLAHLESTPPLEAYVEMSVDFSEESVLSLDEAALPKAWRDYPAPATCATIGDMWIRSRASLALRVPSVIIASEYNYLLNPLHPDFSTVHIGSPTPFHFDPRLLRRQ